MSIERAHTDHHVEAVAEVSHDEGSEAEGADARAAEGGEAGESDEEFRPLGVDVEAIPFIVLAGLVSIALGVAAFVRPHPAVLLAVAIFMALFFVLDVLEVAHQVDEGNAGLATLAAVTAGLHAGAAVVAALFARRRWPTEASVALPA